MSDRSSESPRDSRRVAVLVPCLNEAVTIARVVSAFRAALPEATVYVFDNASTDDTAELAKGAGATVVHSPERGKGAVVRHMFRSIEADVYLMVDGDDTYPADVAPELIEKFFASGADMLVASRTQRPEAGSFRLFHRFGNWLFASLVNRLFHAQLTDVLSGYRAFSREFVKLVPLSSVGFEIETELTLQAIGKRFTVRELPVRYDKRPPGSLSKLSTFRDGVLILQAIASLFRRYKPLVFFSAVAALTALVALGTAILPVLDYMLYKYVYHFPLAVLAAALGLLSALMFSVGLILDTQAAYHAEQFHALRALQRDRERRP